MPYAAYGFLNPIAEDTNLSRQTDRGNKHGASDCKQNTLRKGTFKCHPTTLTHGTPHKNFENISNDAMVAATGASPVDLARGLQPICFR